jgi:asparagine synthase (glutamine-hydrolysing)
MQHADFHVYLHDDLLVKMDRMSMAASLETRSPLLDTALLEYVAGLPPAMKASPSGGKRILRRAAAGLLPPSIVGRRKHGFGVPVAKWFRGDLVEPFRDLVLAGDARTGPLLRRPAVQELLDEHLEGRANHGPRLWSLLALEGWLRGLEVRTPATRRAR